MPRELRDHWGTLAEDLDLLLGQGPKGWGRGGRVMRKAHWQREPLVQRPCGGWYADGVQEVGYRAREQSWQRGHWAGQGGTMDAGGRRLDLPQGFQFMSLKSHRW